MPTTSVIRDGFESCHGRFYVVDVGSLISRPRVERIDTPRLKAMFLPRLTPEANKMFRDHIEFVRCQLKHYAVEFDEGELTGQGTGLIKKALLAGKLDKVPHHIEALRMDMHQDWLAQLTPKELAGSPELAMERYFVDGASKPVKSKTKKPVGFPYDPLSNYRSGQMREAAEKVAGLHHATAYGPGTQTIFVGWNKPAVEKAAKAHVASEEKETEAEAKKKMTERNAKHEEYLADSRDGGGNPGPSGEYMVSCEYIELEWPDSAEGMTISIQRTSRDGVFKATFDFGIVEGIMILGRDEDLVDILSRRRDGGIDDNDYEKEEDEDIDSEDDEPPPMTGSKRKGKSVHRGRPAKIARTTKAARSDKNQNPRLFARLKSKDTSDGVINHITMNGVMEFGGNIGSNNGKGKGKSKEKAEGKKSGGGGQNPFSSFAGRVSLSGIGSDIAFTARKVSDVGNIGSKKWEDYSEREYERANASRWGSSSWW